jgi:hypothetical protein
MTQPGAGPAGNGSPAPRGLAIAALIVGIAAFLFGLIPWFGLLLAIAAVILAVLALRKKQQRTFSLIGLILGGIALVTGIIVAIVFGIAVSNPSAGRAPAALSASEPAAPTPAPTASQAPAPSPTPSETPAPVQPEPVKPAPAADLGSATNPYPQPYVAEGLFGGEKYSLTGSVVDANASALVKEWNQFNDDAPAGFKYVVIQLAMTGIDPDGVEPSLASYDLSLATVEGNRYDSAFIVFGEGMPSMSDGPTLYPGSSFTGFAAYVVPEAAQSFLIYDNGNFIGL